MPVHPSSRLPPPINQLRRNLFPPSTSLSRRPTTSSTSTSATTLREAPPESSEIVLRNPDGDYQVSVPTVPAQEEEQAGDEKGEEKVGTEQLDARIADLRRNRSRVSSELSELFIEVKESLRRRVAGLEEDNWMFEAGK